MREAWSKVFAPGTTVVVAAYVWEYEDDAILFKVTDDALRFSIQREAHPEQVNAQSVPFWIKLCSVYQ